MKNYNVVRTISGIAGLAGVAAGGFAIANTVAAHNLEQGEGVYQLDGAGPGYVFTEGSKITFLDGQPYGSFEPVEPVIAAHKENAREDWQSLVFLEGAALAGLWKARRMRRQQEEVDPHGRPGSATLWRIWDEPGKSDKPTDG